MEPKNPILELYILKAIKERVGKLIETRRTKIEKMASEEAVDQLNDKFGLSVKFTACKGSKTFNEEKAITFLRARLKSRFNQYFRRWEIEKKAGAGEPPPELLEEMKKYFTIKSVAEVEEKKLRSLPLGLSDKEIEDNCYDRKPGYERMDTPTDVELDVLIEYAQKARLDTARLLLED